VWALFVSFLMAVNVLCVGLDWVLIGLCGIATAIAQSSISESNRAWISLHITDQRFDQDKTFHIFLGSFNIFVSFSQQQFHFSISH
jgi:hypothetical protein